MDQPKLLKFKTMRKIIAVTCTLLTGITLLSCSGKTGKDQSENTQVNPKDYPVTGSVLRLDPELDQIIPAGALPEILAEGFEWSEGPLWLPDQQLLIFSDVPKNSIYQWSEDGGLALYLQPSGYTGSIPRGGETGSNGLLLNLEGKLVLCQHGDRRMALMDASLDKPAPEFITLAETWNGMKFNSPNDATYSKSGALFFTDPAYGLEQRYQDPAREMDFTGVFRLDTDGQVTLLTDKLPAPNGIGFSPDGKTLYVANSGGGKQSYWMAYEMDDRGGILGERVFYDAGAAADTLAGAPDGLEVREDGTIFATGPGGVWIFKSSGKPLGIVRTGQPTSNCTVGSDHQYLYMTANMYLMRIRLNDQ
jgi:gluconolactonase